MFPVVFRQAWHGLPVLMDSESKRSVNSQPTMQVLELSNCAEQYDGRTATGGNAPIA